MDVATLVLVLCFAQQMNICGDVKMQVPTELCNPKAVQQMVAQYHPPRRLMFWGCKNGQET
jgi:hypothetical protein